MPDDEKPRRGGRLRLSRDSVLLVFGIAGVVYEAVIRIGEPRAALLAVYVAAMGVVPILRRNGW